MNTHNESSELPPPSGLPGAHRFTVALPAMIAELSRATTRSDVAARIARAWVMSLGASTARVYMTHADGRALHLAAAENVEVSVSSRLAVVDIGDEFPACVAARLGLLRLVDADGPLVFGRARPPGGVALGLPLFAGSETIGAVLAGFDELTPRECMELNALSHPLGALLDRERLGDEVKRLETNRRARDAQTALVVHDLRQPLSAMMLAAWHLANRSDAREQVTLERLRTSGVHLERMIADLSDASLVEAGTFTLIRRVTDFVQVVRDAVGRHYPTARLSVGEDIPPIEVDAQRMDQVLANLLVNARKYGSDEGTTHVEISRRESRLLVSVTSEGEGIAVDERGRVFEAHYRGRDRKKGATGLGLGLYICKRLVEEHGGGIWTDGEPPRTRFTFWLPIASVPESSLASEPESPTEASGVHAVSKRPEAASV